MSLEIAGSFTGFVEGTEAGLGVESLQADEQNARKRWLTRALGVGATATGLYVGHRVGSEVEEAIEHTIGEAGTSFLPAIAVGSMMWWHAVREKRPDQHMSKVMKSAPVALVAAFSAWEGAEAGILGASSNTKLGAVALMAAAGYAAGSGVVELMRRGIRKINPKNFMRNVRLGALVPAAAIGTMGAAELAEHPTVGGVVAAGLGVAALAGAARANLRQDQPQPTQN